MEIKRYLFVDAENIRMVDYMFVDQVFHGLDYPYNKPNSIAIGGETSVQIFENNNIPREYQKMILEYNYLKKQVNICSNKFKACEYLTDTPIQLIYNKNGNILGQMKGGMPTFDVNNCYVCERQDVINFITNLRKEKLLDNYLKALEEIMHLSIKSYFDSNASKIKKR